MTSTLPNHGNDNGAAGKLIPGAYERNTPTQRQPGAMGGAPFGSDGIPVGPSTMSAATIAEREKEGGQVLTTLPSAFVHPNKKSWYRCYLAIASM